MIFVKLAPILCTVMLSWLVTLQVLFSNCLLFVYKTRIDPYAFDSIACYKNFLFSQKTSRLLRALYTNIHFICRQSFLSYCPVFMLCLWTTPIGTCYVAQVGLELHTLPWLALNSRFSCLCFPLHESGYCRMCYCNWPYFSLFLFLFLLLLLLLNMYILLISIKLYNIEASSSRTWELTS